ncbi:MAG: GtrA family protein [Actinomycetota bacterium]|nr:GtrA family protein [Actinomycetota bacterium]MDA8208986.1 GtrA family protein [Actinomycetota bacterium]
MNFVSRILEKYRSSDSFVKAFRYSVTSGVSVIVGQVVLFVLFGLSRRFTAVTSNIIATAVSAVPAYYMNRAWAWGKSGRSHFWKEIFPFWGLAFLGLGISIYAVAFADTFARSHDYTHLSTALLVNVASIAAFGVLWVGKFFIFNRFLFATTEALPEAESDIPEAV